MKYNTEIDEFMNNETGDDFTSHIEKEATRQTEILKPLLILTTDLTNPWNNLALEEYLLGLCQSDLTGSEDRPYGAILFLWQNRHTVVIGRNQNAWAECKTGLLEDENGFLARRGTGGGAVYHDLGNLNFSIILPRAKFDLGESFQVILDAVKSLGLDAVRSGRNDILLDGRKFSGNAFRYMRGVALHHGTLMVDTDVEPMMRYLTVSDSKLKTRAIKSVKSRVINLREVKHDLTITELMDAVGTSFAEQYGEGRSIVQRTVEEFPRDKILADLEALYASWEWRYGRAIDFDAQVETKRFPWGQADIRFKVTQGIIAETTIYSDALDSDFIDCIARSLIGVPFTSREMAKRIKTLGNADETVGDIPQTVIAEDIAQTLLDEAY